MKRRHAIQLVASAVALLIAPQSAIANIDEASELLVEKHAPQEFIVSNGAELRAALKAEGPRTIIFARSGIYVLDDGEEIYVHGDDTRLRQQP